MDNNLQFHLAIAGRMVGSDELVDSKIAAKILGLSPRTVRDYATKGTIPSYKLNSRTTRFLVYDLVEWLTKR